MSESPVERSGIVVPLQPIAAARVDESAAPIIDLLQEHLKLAWDGQFRSIAVVAVSADGSAIGTQWSCSNGDPAALIGKLAVLTHDLMAARA